MPKPPIHTIVIEARTDIRLLASILSFYTGQDIYLPTRASLLARIIEDYHILLVQNQLITPENNTQTAHAYLGKHFGKLPRKSVAKLFAQIEVEKTISQEDKKYTVDTKEGLLDKLAKEGE